MFIQSVIVNFVCNNNQQSRRTWPGMLHLPYDCCVLFLCCITACSVGRTMTDSKVGDRNLIVLYTAVVIQEMGQTCLFACLCSTVNTHYVRDASLGAEGFPWLHKTMHRNWLIEKGSTKMLVSVTKSSNYVFEIVLILSNSDLSNLKGITRKFDIYR